MAYRGDQLLADVPPMLPNVGSGGGATTGQDPATMEQMFNPSREEPPQNMPQAGRMVASNADVPMPEPGSREVPPLPERREEGATVQSLIKPDDTRYKDPQNLIMGNAIMGGMLPWAQAAADVAAGRVPKEQFDEARMEHQRRIEELQQQHPEFTSAAEKTVPFLEGLGMSIAKPAGTVAGVMKRGAAVGMTTGAARGYTSGPVEEPSLSADRAARAAGGAAVDTAIGTAGAAVPGIVKAGKSMVGKVSSIAAERAATKANEAAAKKLDAEARATAATTESRKLTAANESERMKALDKQYVAENKRIQSEYAQHTSMPEGGLARTWEENRKHFAADPVHVYNQMVDKGIGLEGMTKVLNLPASVIVSRLSSKQIDKETPLFKELMDASNTIDQFKQRGLTVPKAKAAAKSSDAPAAKPASPAAPSNPAPKAKAASAPKKSNVRSDDNPYGEGPYTAKGSRKKK